MNYHERLTQRIKSSGSNLCVGLDPRPDLIEGNVADFVYRVIDETAEHTAAYKPNSAYFEALGSTGIKILETLRDRIPKEIPLLLDCKRSDIGETQRYYAKACFDIFGADAVTLNPFLGFDTIEPFLEHSSKGIYLLCVTSNQGSQDLQMLQTKETYVFNHVQQFADRAPEGSIGLVVGLTNASEEVLNLIKDVPLLLPGLGAQGGDLKALANQGRTAPMLVNVSRGLLYANPEKSFELKAKEYVQQITAVLGRSA